MIYWSNNLFQNERTFGAEKLPKLLDQDMLVAGQKCVVCGKILSPRVFGLQRRWTWVVPNRLSQIDLMFALRDVGAQHVDGCLTVVHESVYTNAGVQRRAFTPCVCCKRTITADGLTFTLQEAYIKCVRDTDSLQTEAVNRTSALHSYKTTFGTRRLLSFELIVPVAWTQSVLFVVLTS